MCGKTAGKAPRTARRRVVAVWYHNRVYLAAMVAGQPYIDSTHADCWPEDLYRLAMRAIRDAGL